MKLNKEMFLSQLSFVIIAVLILRLFFAFEWISSGSSKISSISTNPQQYFNGIQNTLNNWARNNPYSWWVPALNAFASNVSFYVTFVAISELLMGIGYLLGALVRLASIGGMLLNTIIFLSAGYTSTSTAGINVMMFGGQLFLLLVSAGRAYGFDAIFHKKWTKLPVF